MHIPRLLILPALLALIMTGLTACSGATPTGQNTVREYPEDTTSTRGAMDRDASGDAVGTQTTDPMTGTYMDDTRTPPPDRTE